MSRPKTSLVGDFEQKTQTAYGLGYNPQEQGTTIRPPSSSLFCISSADRYKTIAERRAQLTSPFRFSITKNESLLNGFLSRLALTEVRFPWTLPNVSAEAGTNTIQITQGAATHTITITDGFYTPAELAVEITDVWNTAYPATQILLDFRPDQGFFTLASAPAGTAVAIAPNPAITTGYKQLFDIMNWPPTAQTPAIFLPNSGVVNLRWTDYIDIVCTQLTYNQDLKDTSSQQVVRDMLCRLYLDESVPSDASYMNAVQPALQYNAAVPPVVVGSIETELVGYGGKQNGCRPCILYRQFQTPKYIKWNRIQPVGQVQFEIYDDQGRALADYVPATAYLAGNDWNITLLASEQ